jgi:glycosyltransferase involved in cell wall biosynthesis
MKFVSIGMPVYNEEKFIEQAIVSILNQDYQNFELIISDNASTDKTKEICLKYSKIDSRIRFYSQDSTTDSTTNFNYVASIATGDFFMWASGHDTRDTQFISRCLTTFEKSNSIVLCYSDAIWIDSKGDNISIEQSNLDTVGMDRIKRIKKVFWNLGYAYPIYGLFRKDTLNTVLPYQKVLAPDVLLLNELSAMGEFARIPEPLFFIRKLSDYGDWHSYFQKSLNINVNRKKAISLFFEFIIKNYRGVKKHAQSPKENLMIMKIFLFDSFLKYHWILLGLIRLDERQG